MKKLIAALIVTMFSLAGVQAIAQNLQDDVYLGIGAAYGEEIDVIGLQVNGAFAVTDNFRVAADWTHFFTYEVGTSMGTYEQKMFELNFNAHAFLVNAENAAVYVLAGLNYSRAENSGNIGAFNVSDTESEIGANLGGGLEFMMERAGIFIEPKYTLSGADQFNVTAGLRFRF